MEHFKSYLTAEQIVAKAEEKSQTELGIRREINRIFRAQDDSSLWPIRGRFDVTERAIRRANKIERANGAMSPLEYAYSLEAETGRIVNDERNW